MLTFTGYGNAPYSLISRDNCYIRKGSDTVGYIQGLQINGSTLSLEHFAVNPDKRGDIKADDMLRGFAKLVKSENSDIEIITFDLGRATSDSDIKRLANAREVLLKRVGAVNVKQTKVNPSRIVVSGDWHKAMW